MSCRYLIVPLVVLAGCNVQDGGTAVAPLPDGSAPTPAPVVGATLDARADVVAAPADTAPAHDGASPLDVRPPADARLEADSRPPADAAAPEAPAPPLDAAVPDRAPAPDLAPDVSPDLPPDLVPDLAPDASPTVEIRINVNGPDHTGLDYPGRWAHDPGPGGVCSPNHFENAAPIHGTRDGDLFHGEMFGSPLVCAVGGGKLPPGLYRVNLYFAEIYWGPGCPGATFGTGSRVFDVRIEDQPSLTNFDIFSEGGCAASTLGSGKPVVKRFTVPIMDGTLDLRFDAHKDNAKISAIEIISAF